MEEHPASISHPRGSSIRSRLRSTGCSYVVSTSAACLIRLCYTPPSLPRLFRRGWGHSWCDTFSPMAAMCWRCGRCRGHDERCKVGCRWDPTRVAGRAGEDQLDLHEVIESALPQRDGEDSQAIARGGLLFSSCTPIGPEHCGYGRGVRHTNRVTQHRLREFSVDRDRALRAVAWRGIGCPPTAIVGEQRGSRRSGTFAENDGDRSVGVSGTEVLISLPQATITSVRNKEQTQTLYFKSTGKDV